MSRLVLAFVVLLATTLVACGDDEPSEQVDGDEASGLTAQPEPSEPIEEVLGPLNAAIEEGDCEAFAALTHSQLRPKAGEPDAPATREECEFIEPFLKDLRGAEFTESAEFGTGAITQADAPPALAQEGEVAAFIWLLDSDGTFGQTSLFVGDAQIGEEPAGDPLPPVEDFVAAVPGRDCSEIEPLLNPGGSLVGYAEGNKRKACELVTKGRIFLPALEETAEPALEVFGGTLDIGFVGVATESEYFTVTVGTPPADPGDPQQTEMLIDDVRPNTFTAEDADELEK